MYTCAGFPVLIAMPAHNLKSIAFSLLILSQTVLAQSKGADTVDRAALASELAKQNGLSSQQILPLLNKAQYQQSIIDAITRPAEAKPWSAYRPIFMTEARIRDGRQFLADHRDALTQVASSTGVPAELIVAIIGVETNYGKITGSYRVLDALYTLGAHYPPRQDFFRSELAQIFLLAEEEKLSLEELKGSYAGAMGWGQFMPSSYRHYAKDGDGDGRRDLFQSKADVFASVANYFVAHGWQAGQPVAVPARWSGKDAPPKSATLKPDFTVAGLRKAGVEWDAEVADTLPATVLTLDGAEGPEYWLTFDNFYVISRYNRSPLYSMAVLQLSQALAADRSTTQAP